jgi:hypothetical protein
MAGSHSRLVEIGLSAIEIEDPDGRTFDLHDAIASNKLLAKIAIDHQELIDFSIFRDERSQRRDSNCLYTDLAPIR